MRASILTCFISLLLCLCVAGQKTKDYKFVYRLQPASFNDTESFIIDTLTNSKSISTIKAVINNYQSKPIGFLTIIFKNVDTTIKTITNEKGLFSLNVKPSNYELTILGVGYKTLIKQLSIDKNNNYNIAINLARQSVMNLYDIHSRKKLSQADIDNIKNCIQNNEQSLDKCKKKYDYYITLEI